MMTHNECQGEPISYSVISEDQGQQSTIMTNKQKMVRYTRTTQHKPLSAGLSLYPFQTLLLSQVSTLAKHHVLFFQAIFRKTPLIYSQPNIFSQESFQKKKSHNTNESPKKSETSTSPLCEDKGVCYEHIKEIK